MLNLMFAVCHWLVVCLDSKVEVGKERKAQQKRLKLSEHIGCPMHVKRICNCHARW